MKRKVPPAQRKTPPSPRQFGVQQRQFLEKVRDEFKFLDEIEKECNVSARQLTMWLKRRRFKRTLNASVQSGLQRLWLELELGRIAGARRLTSLTRSRDAQVARLASLNLVTLNRISRQVMEKAKASREQDEEATDPNAPPPAPPAPAVHPDCPPEEAERIFKEWQATEAGE